MTTSKGHMHQTRNNLKPTKPQDSTRQEEKSITPLEKCTNTVFTNTIDHKRQISTDLTVKLTLTSNRGDKHLFVLYKYDSNSIMKYPMKARTDSEFIRLFKDLHYQVFTRVINPAYTRLVNKAYIAFQRELKPKDIDFQLAPPGMHLRNAAECEICTFKDHFIAVF